MGRVGIEPTTLGLRVRPDELKRATPSGKPLLRGAFHFATNCYKLHASETNRYAHRYAQLLAGSPGFEGLSGKAAPLSYAALTRLGSAQVMWGQVR
jgi:hypothetical protein